LLKRALSQPDIDVILTNGGTGISKRDQTISVIEKIITQPLPGFGELFRMLSYEQIGAAAMMSRATAGTANGKAIFVLPGSPDAVRLAMTKLIVPELGHVVQQLSR
jgi:molybdenum cofactor biosynthesis protein B